MGTYTTAIAEAAAKSGVEADAEAVTSEQGKTKEPAESRTVTRSKESRTETAASDSKAEPYHPLLSDVDLSDMTDKEKAKVLEKVKAYDKQFHRENTAFKTFKQFQSLYRENAGFAKDVDAALGKHTGNRRDADPEPEVKASATEAGVSKRIDQLLAKATTAEEREAVREARQIIVEETADYSKHLEKAQKRIDALERDLAEIRTERKTTRISAFEKDLDGLEATYSSSLIEKYRDTMLDWSVKYPSKSAEWILYKLAEPEELRDAKLPAKNGNGKSSTPRRPAASVTSAEPESASPEQFKTVAKGTRWDLGRAFRHLHEGKRAS